MVQLLAMTPSCVYLRSRRCWNPNVQKTTLYSNTLDRTVQLKVTTYALRSGTYTGICKKSLKSSSQLQVTCVCRCIDKAGGLDRYLLKSSDQELGSDIGSRLKAEIVAKRQMQKLQKAAQQNMLPFAASATTTSEVL